MADRKISDLTALTTPATGDLIPIVDVSEAAAADKNKSITVGELLRGAPDGTAAAPGIAFESDGGNGIFLAGTDQVGVATGGVERVEFGASEVVFNDGGADYDFRIEGDTNTALFFVDASTDRVGVGTTSPNFKLSVNAGAANSDVAEFTGTATGRGLLISTSNDGGVNDDSVHYNVQRGSGSHIFEIADSEKVRIDSSGRVGIGTSSPSEILDLRSTGTTRIFFESNDGGSPEYRATVGVDSGGFKIQTRDGTYGSNTDRLTIDTSGNVGIGTTSVNSLLEVRGTSDGQNVLHLSNSAGTGDGDVENQIRVTCNGNTNWANLDIQAYQTIFTQNGGEKARIDNSGRLLVGTSTARTNLLNSTFSSQLQVEGTGHDNSSVSMVRNSANSGAPYFNIGKSRGTSAGSSTVVQSGDGLGVISFQGADGSEMVEAAAIIAQVDGTPGSNDMPGRLVFSTTADGASSPTERMRIDRNGRVSIAHDGSYYAAGETLSISASDDGNVHVGRATNASYSSNLMYYYTSRAGSSVYNFLVYASNGASDTEFKLRGDGNAYADGSWSGGGADYAEYFEWSDGNTSSEDRRGISVVLDGDKIREAVAGEEPIGVISGNPSVVGDADIDRWKGKYLRDDYGTYIEEDYDVEDEDGNTVVQQRRKLNPDYDPDVEYISREDRPEWDCVGLMGKLRIRKGQVTGARWIKMRDVSDNVEEWLVR